MKRRDFIVRGVLGAAAAGSLPGSDLMAGPARPAEGTAGGQVAGGPVVISSANGVGRGSARSTPGIPIHEVLAACSDTLLRSGGHAMAGGLEIEPKRIPAFREAFLDATSRFAATGAPAPPLAIDLDLPLPVVDRGLLVELDRLAPFGAGNRRPILASGDLELAGPPRTIGADGDHLAFEVGHGRHRRRAVGFKLAHRLSELLACGSRMELAFHVTHDAYRPAMPQLEVIDFRAAT